ncbi:MAG: NUDIX domain-containing protein [Candidatus Eisenbacteria bacterium]|uniref:NUDIX domain-containing protein n=1 Tax=Eiseniibacteriota bacterium TaxID=2212470 RepID=A0A538T9H1_UNCEI|nr:MAG: NUDIX domain-containing protein [Candidatus Eisenbacteria bacterium]
MRSAGLLLYRARDGARQVFLVHPGGPYWVGKDLGAWSIPKGEFGSEEDPLDAAKREFGEETGCVPPEGPYTALGALPQPSGKIIEAWAVPGDCDPDAVRSNTFTMEWPPRSGRRQDFPEIDRAGWFGIEEAHRRIIKGQRGFLTALERSLPSA